MNSALISNGQLQPNELFPIQSAVSPRPPAKRTVFYVAVHHAIKAYETYGKHGQTLRRIGERGGFGEQEFACLFAGCKPVCCKCKWPEEVNKIYIPNY